MIWTLWIQIGQPYGKVLCNKRAPIIAWNPWMWSADFKQKFLPKTHFGRLKCIIDNPPKNSSHENQKVLRGVRENQRIVYFQKFFFLEFMLCIRRMPFWQLCWELLGKGLKLYLPKSIKDSNYLFFAKFVPSKISSRHFPTEFLRFFSLNNRRCWILFLQNIFLAKC